MDTGVLSPVSPASSISSVAATRIRPSAGTLSPASKPTMSPGTSSSAGTSTQLAVAADVRRHDQHLAQRGDALGGLALLVQAHHRVEDRQAEDDQAGRDVLQGDDADHRRADEHQLHQVAVLAQERLPAGLLGLLGQLVRPVPLPPLEHLGGAQADGRIDVQPATRVSGVELVPRRLGLGRIRRRWRGRS